MSDFIAFAHDNGVVIRDLRIGRISRCPTVDHPKSTNGAFFYDGQRGWVWRWDEGDQEPLRTLPRPSIRPDNTKLIPSKPERGNATVKPPRLSKSERDAVTLQKTLAGTKWAEMQQPGKRKKRVTQSRSPAAVQRTSTIWEGEKSEDILDSRARLAGSAFSGKRGR